MPDENLGGVQLPDPVSVRLGREPALHRAWTAAVVGFAGDVEVEREELREDVVIGGKAKASRTAASSAAWTVSSRLFPGWRSVSYWVLTDAHLHTNDATMMTTDRRSATSDVVTLAA